MKSFNAGDAVFTAAEQARREADRRFRTMADTAPVLIWETDPSGAVFLNQRYLEFFGMDFEAVRATGWAEFLHPDDATAYIEVYREAFERRQPYTHECRMRRADGQYRWLLTTGGPLGVDHFVGYCADITENKRTEELLRQKEERNERRRIALDMHDEFGQQLSALAMRLSALQRDCDRRTNLGAELAALETMTRQLDLDLELIVWRLRPPDLDELGLTTAFARYVKRWSDTTGVRAEWHPTGVTSGHLTGEMEIALYRIAQEALNNVAKHAHASHVAILLDVRSDRASLIIEDDGAGFDLQYPSGLRQQFGLNGMRERAALAGGTLDLESVPGKGTTVVARIPFPVSPQGGKM